MKSMEHFAEHAEALNQRNGGICFGRENFPALRNNLNKRVFNTQLSNTDRNQP